MAMVNGRKSWVSGSKDLSPSVTFSTCSEPQINALSDDRSAEHQPKRALDFFSGSGSVRRTLRRHGFEVVSLDVDPSTHPTILTDILEWDFMSEYPPGYFQIITASPPCTEFSAALSTRERDLQGAVAIVQRTLRIIEYFRPPIWWLENPRYGWLSNQVCMEGLPFTDHDYCQYTEWGYQKPTRFWGSDHVKGLKSRVCDGRTCPNLRDDGKGHIERLGGNHMTSSRREKYRIPCKLVEYLCGLSQNDEGHGNAPARRVAHVTATPLDATAEFLDIQHEVTKCGMATLPEIPDMPGSDSDDEDEYLPNMATIWEVTQQLDAERRQCGFVKGAVEARDPASGTDIEKIIEEIKERFSKNSLSGVLPNDREPPVRGPFGEAEI